MLNRSCSIYEELQVPNHYHPHADRETEYSGRILTGNYSEKLKETVREQVDACRAFDRIGLTVMPYISAWQVDRPGIWYEFVSHRFLDLFGVPSSRLGKEFRNAILDRREYERAEICPDIKEMVLPRHELENQWNRLRGESILAGETEAVYKVRLPDNRVRWLKDCASVTPFIEDSICLSPGYLADVSMEMSQKDQVDELNVMVNRDKGLLVEAERHAAMGQLSAKVYHEVRNPILSIGGLAKRLAEQQPNDGTRPYMAVIVNEAERLEKILNNLFRFTTPVELDLSPTDPVNLVKRVVGLLRSELGRYGIQVSLVCPQNHPFIFIDQEQIHEALIHIIKNSIDALPDGGNLKIHLTGEKEYVSIIIRDSGAGICATHENRLTEPFFTTKVYGSGLGLSIAKKAVQLHGGKLIIRGLDSGGTEVQMLLPLNEQIKNSN
ncbi:MAG: ATP-binding protein [Desulfobulbaceae bacterium]|nr:ATP-binding protein [Desulfobulbaceae bacterium]